MTPRPTAIELADLEARRQADTLRSLSRRDVPADGAREAIAWIIDRPAFAMGRTDHEHRRQRVLHQADAILALIRVPVDAQTQRAAIEKVVRKWLQFGAEEMVDEILTALQPSGDKDGQ